MSSERESRRADEALKQKPAEDKIHSRVGSGKAAKPF